MSFIFKVSGTGAVFLFSVLLSRNFGADKAGLFFIVFSFNELLSMIARLGLPQSSIALVGKYYSDEDWSRAKGFIKYGFKYIATASTVVGVLVFVFAPQIANFVFSDERLVDILRISCLAIPPVALIRFVGCTLQGLHHIPRSQFVLECSEHFFLLFIFFLFVSLDSIELAVMAYVASSWIALGVSLFILYKKTNFMRSYISVFSKKDTFKTAMPLLWTNVLMIINSRAGVFALGIMSTPYNVGIYNVSFKISLLSNFILMSVVAVCAPKFSSLYRKGEYDNIRVLLKNSTRLIIILTIPAIMPIVFFPEFFLSLFGTDFSNGGNILIILILGQCFNIATGPVGTLLAMTGYEKDLRNVYIFSTPVNIILQILLVPLYGALGGAIATTTFVAILNVWVLVVVKRKLKMTVF